MPLLFLTNYQHIGVATFYRQQEEGALSALDVHHLLRFNPVIFIIGFFKSRKCKLTQGCSL